MNYVLVDYNLILSSVSEDKAFRLPDGSLIRSLSELSDNLKKIDEILFTHHVNSDKNDFSNWIKHCFNDDLLAFRIQKILDKNRIADEIKSRIEQAKENIRLNNNPNNTQTKQLNEQNINNDPALKINQLNNENNTQTQSTNNEKTIPEISNEQLNSLNNNVINSVKLEQNTNEINDDLDDETDLDDNLNDDLEQDIDTETDSLDELDEKIDNDQELDALDDIEELDDNTDLDQIDDDDILENVKETNNKINNTTIKVNETNEKSTIGIQLDNVPGQNIEQKSAENIQKTEQITKINPQQTQEVKPEPIIEVKQQTQEVKPEPIIEVKQQTQEVKPEPIIEVKQQTQEVKPEPIIEVKQQTQEQIQEFSEQDLKLLNTPNQELNPAQLFKKIKLQKQKNPQITQTANPITQTSAQITQTNIQTPNQPKQLSTEEKKLLDTPNEELNPSELFRKIKIEKELAGNSQQNIVQIKEDKGLSEQDLKILNTPNQELNPAQLFKKIKLQKQMGTYQDITKSAAPTTQSLEQNKIQNINKTQQNNHNGGINSDLLKEKEKIKELAKQSYATNDKPIDLLKISDDEFNKLIGINVKDKYVATIVESKQKNLTKKTYLKTGVPGFDDLIEKGIPEGSSILISGGPGSGKTTFCLQQLGWASRHGEKTLFITLEEKQEQLIEHMDAFGLSPESLITDDNLRIMKLDSFKISRSVEALLANARGELMIDLDPVLGIIPPDFKPTRIVLDSLSSVAAAFAGQPEVYRIYVEQLFKIFEKLNATSFIITEVHGAEEAGHGGVEDFLADGVINFYSMKKGTRRQPAIEILKMRGVNHKRKVVPFEFIAGKGIEIYPMEEVFHV